MVTSHTSESSRREFLGTAAALAGASAMQAAKQGRVVGANDRINLGMIGVGTRGFGHVKSLKRLADAGGQFQIVAVSDVYKLRRDRARDYLKLAAKDITIEYHDILARPDIDAVFIATPDHWHFRMAMDALAAGKDIYLEKPMTYTVAEAKELSEQVKKSGRVMQIGSQYASEPIYHKARELMKENIIGKPLLVQGTYSRSSHQGEWDYHVDDEGTPETIDWKRFLGNAPKRPFSPDRFFRWRKYWDYSGGISTDLLYHRLTPFMFVLGPQFPTRVSANGGIYVHKDREVPDTISTCVEYQDFTVVMTSSMASHAPNRLITPAILGHEATMEFRSSKDLVIVPDELYAKEFQAKHGVKELHIPITAINIGDAHIVNFLDSVRSRKQPVFDAEYGYKVMVAIGLGVEAYKEGRQMSFDPKTEKVLKTPPKRDAYEGDGHNTEESITP